MLHRRDSSAAVAGAVLLLLMVAVATVASVPTSVLVQNSEMASNSNGRNGNNYDFNNLKVKRSSSSSATSAAAALNKKSSPETVPASFNAPPPGAGSAAAASTSSQAAAATSAQSQSPSQPASGTGSSSLPTNGDIINSAIAAGLTAAAVEAAAAASQRELEQQQMQLQQQQQYGDEYVGLNDDEPPTLLHKRGVNAQQYLYGGAGLGGGSGSRSGLGLSGYGSAYGAGYGGDNYIGSYYGGPLASASASQPAAVAGVPSGVWADEIDPQMAYSDLQEFEDYAPRAPYRNKAYDNLQNILNSETYLEPVLPALPIQYPGRFYGAEADRKKRSNLNKFGKFADMRLKRDTKLTPADMLALVALVEAGERSRKDSDAEPAYLAYPDAYDSNNNNFGSGKSLYYPSGYEYQPSVGSNSYGNVNGNNNLDDVGEFNGAWLEPAMVDYYGVPYNVEAVPKYEMSRDRQNSLSGYGAKRFMVSKKKRSLGQFLNEPVAKPIFSYNTANGEKYF